MVHVDTVAQGLKRVETDPDRKDYFQGIEGYRKADPLAQAHRALGEKVEVLEESEDSQISDEADRQPQFASAGAALSGQAYSQYGRYRYHPGQWSHK